VWALLSAFFQINNNFEWKLHVQIYFHSDGRGTISSIEKLAINVESAVLQTILVVEDEPRVRRVVIRDLENLNYRTIEAENAAMAMLIIESGVEIDLIFSDILMPGNMDGQMLGSWVREHYPNIKIVQSTTIVMAALVGHSATPQVLHQFQSVRLASLDDSQTKKVSFSKTQTVRSAKNVNLGGGVTRSVAQKNQHVLIAIQEDTRQQLHRPKKVTVLSAMLENILN